MSRVDVILNELTAIRADLGSLRPDVPLVLNERDAPPSCGWAATVDLTSWPLGELRVKVVATSRSGMSSVIGDRLYAIEGAGFEGHLDDPREGLEIHGDLLVVRGWATIAQQLASRIDIDVNGQRAGQARLRLARMDVERRSHGRLGPVTGFEYRGLVSHADSATVDVGVTVHALDGSTVAIPARHIRVVAEDYSRNEALGTTMHARTQLALARTPRPDPTVSRKPQLLVFTHSLTIGGGQLYLADLLTQLRPTLAGCTVVSSVDGILRGTLEELGAEVVISSEHPPRDIQKYEKYIRERALFIRASGCDVVLLNTLGPWSAGDAALRADVPLLWSIHESFVLSDWIALNYGNAGLPTYVRRRLEAALDGAVHLIFESEATSAMFSRYASAASRSVVRYGVDTAGIDHFAAQFDRSAARANYALPDDATILLSMGVLEERKSQACIVEAFVAVAAAHPDAYLVMVGDHPSEYSQAIHEMIQTAACADRISLFPITSSIWEWYALSDVLVSASDIESLPRSMLECMAFGVPVLSTAVFGVPELVDDGGNGWLFAARDMAALIAALDGVLLLTRAERHAAGAVARATVKERYPLTNYANAYRALLGSALAVRQRGSVTE